MAKNKGTGLLRQHGSALSGRRRFRRGLFSALLLLCALSLLCGCGETLSVAMPALPKAEDDAEALTPIVEENSAPGDSLYTSSDGSAALDCSNTADGYVMVAISTEDDVKHVVMLTGPDGAQYKYYSVATDGSFLAYPLSGGSGSYTLAVYRNISGTSYSTVCAFDFSAQIKDELTPFLRPNYFVDYNADTLCVREGCRICAGVTDELERIAAVFNCVTGRYKYDYDKAATVSTGYRPVLDESWKDKKGICFDYASAMCAMLRTLGIPCRLVIGYAGEEYHAWISAYTKEQGWVESIIYFDGTVWTYMDPTLVSVSGKTVVKQLADTYYNGLFVY